MRLQENAERVLYARLESGQQLGCHRAVDNTVVRGEGATHHCGTASWPSRTTGRCSAAPTARIPAWAG